MTRRFDPCASIMTNQSIAITLNESRVQQRRAIVDQIRGCEEVSGQIPLTLKSASDVKRESCLLTKHSDPGCLSFLSQFADLLAHASTPTSSKCLAADFLDSGNHLYHLVGILIDPHKAGEETRLQAVNCINSLAAACFDDKRLSSKLAKASSIYLLLYAEGTLFGALRDVCLIALGSLALSTGGSVVLMRQEIVPWTLRHLKSHSEAELYLLHSLLSDVANVPSFLTRPIFVYLGHVIGKVDDFRCKLLACRCLYTLLFNAFEAASFLDVDLWTILAGQLIKMLSAKIGDTTEATFPELRVLFFLVRCCGALACFDNYFGGFSAISGEQFMKMVLALLNHPSCALQKEALWMLNNLMSHSSILCALPSDWKSSLRPSVERIKSTTICSDTQLLASKLL